MPPSKCVALLFVGTEPVATGTYRDGLISERGGWYFTSRELDWDVMPEHRLATGMSR